MYRWWNWYSCAGLNEVTIGLAAHPHHSVKIPLHIKYDLKGLKRGKIICFNLYPLFTIRSV